MEGKGIRREGKEWEGTGKKGKGKGKEGKEKRKGEKGGREGEEGERCPPNADSWIRPWQLVLAGVTRSSNYTYNTLFSFYLLMLCICDE